MLRLTDEERANIRAALLAMGPERRARLEGQCFPQRNGGVGCYVNTKGQCVNACLAGDECPMLTTTHLRHMGLTRGYLSGVRGVQALNDRGKLRTRAAVAELLALAD